MKKENFGIAWTVADPMAGWGGGGEGWRGIGKHEIYVAAFGGHLFMIYFTGPGLMTFKIYHLMSKNTAG